jgi:FkbM family methyltransferase
MVSTFKQLLKAGFNQVGLDLLRTKNSPAYTLLGLRFRPIRTVIDVGANTGQFAKKISGFFPHAKTYCFEPLPEPYAALEKWARTQNGRVLPFNLAVGDQEGEAEMFLHEEHTPSSSLLATTKLTEQYYPFTKGQRRVVVRQATLDTALSEAGDELAGEILIKLDVQGYEDRVIAGGNNIFSKAAACILEVSLDKLYEGQADFKQLFMKLDELGYRYAGNLEQAYAEDGHCVFLDAVFLNKSIIK